MLVGSCQVYSYIFAQKTFGTNLYSIFFQSLIHTFFLITIYDQCHGVSSTNMAHCPFRLPLWIAISAGTGVGRCMFLPSLADAWQRTREKKMLRKQALFICQACFESIIMGKVSSFQAMT